MKMLKPPSDNMKCILALLFLLVVLIGGYRIGKGSGLFQSLVPLPPAHTIKELLEQRGHWERNKPLMAVLGIAPETPLAPELLPSRGRSTSGEYETLLDDATLLRFTNSGVLTKYGRLVGLVEESTSPMKHTPETPVNKEAMLSLAESLLATSAFDESQYDGLKFNIDEKYVTYRAEDHSTPPDGAPEKPEDGTWSIRIERSYRGIGCLSMVMITVDVATGRIEMIANLPFYLPKSTEENISESEAVEVAKRYAEKRSVPTDTYESRKEFSYVGDPLKSLWGFGPSSVLCWVITFQIPESEHAHPYRVLVDCRTGKVVDVVT
jgi:hypothetical protein